MIPSLEIIIAIILLLILFYSVGIRAYRSHGGLWAKDPKKYFLWDRSANHKHVGFSYAASMVSASVFIPFPALFYTHGIGGWLFICLPVIAGTSTLYWFGTRYSRLADSFENSLDRDIYSPYEIIGYSYNSKSLGGLIFVLTGIFVVPLISMQIVGFGRLMEGMYDFNYYLAILILITLFLVYTIFAGMEGDVMTDIYQAGAMLLGLIFLGGYSIYLLFFIDFTASEAINFDQYLRVPGPEGFFNTSTLVSIGLLMAALPIVNGHYLMRFLIAKDNKSLNKSTISASLLIFVFYLLTAIIGLCGIFIEPNLSSGDLLTGALLDNAIDASSSSLVISAKIVAGFVLFGIISASLSSVDSQFLSIGASASRDVFKNLLGYSLNKPQEMFIAKIIMTIIGVAAIAMALNPPRLVIQLNILAASGVFLLLPTIIGAVFYPKKYTSLVPLTSIIIGCIIFFSIFYIYGSNGFYGWNPGIIATIGSTLAFLITAKLDDNEIKIS